MHFEGYINNRVRLWQEPRCRTFVATAVAVAGVGLGAASAAGAFSPTVNEPDTQAEAEQMQQLEAQYLPAILGLQAAQQEGGSYTLPPDIAQALQQAGIQLSGGQASPQQASQLSSLQSQLAAAQQQLQNTPQSSGMTEKGIPIPNQAYSQLQYQIQNLKGQISNINNNVGSTANFAGEGTAQTEGQIMQQEAAGQLANAQEFDPQFIATALQEEQQANPQQFAARQAEYNDIQNELNNPIPSPVSQTLNDQISERVAAGNQLTPEEQAMLQSAVAQSGGGDPNSFETQLTTGLPGEQRALGNTMAGTSFLASGETPSDIALREQQQGISNLSNFANSTTPEAQFGELSGAQSTATPNFQSGWSPSYSGQAAAELGQTGAATQYGENVDTALNYANPWTAGLSGVLSGANTLANAGVI